MSDIDLRDLEAFATVARCRNFRRAAAELRISASSLSERVRSMEEQLGTRLLNRTTGAWRRPKPESGCCSVLAPHWEK